MAGLTMATNEDKKDKYSDEKIIARAKDFFQQVMDVESEQRKEDRKSTRLNSSH